METSRLTSPQIRYHRLGLATLLAASLAAIINAVLFLVGSALGQFPETLVIPASGQGVTLGPVIFMSAMGAIGGALVYALLGKFTKRPVRWFRIIGVIVLVLSFGSPFAFPNAPFGFYVILLLMHVVAGLSTILVLTTLAVTNP